MILHAVARDLHAGWRLRTAGYWEGACHHHVSVYLFLCEILTTNMSKPWAFVLSCGVVYAHSNASASLPVTFVIGNNRLNVRNCTAFALMRPSFRYAGSAGRGARSSRPTRRQRWLRMDDEIARQGIKEVGGILSLPYLHPC